MTRITHLAHDQELLLVYHYIRDWQEMGRIVATSPTLPGCIDANTLRKEWVSAYVYELSHRTFGKFQQIDDVPASIRRLYTDVYVSLTTHQDVPKVAPGFAVIIGNRVALFPGELNGDQLPDMDPLWLDDAMLSGYASRFLRDIAWRAGKHGIPIFPVSLYIADDPRYPYPAIESEGTEPWIDLRQCTISNVQSEAAVVGYATTDSGGMVYLHLAGPQMSVKSIFATLIQGKRAAMYAPSYHTVYGLGEYGYRMFLNPIPGTKEYRGILVMPSVLGQVFPGDNWSYLVLRASDTADRYEALAYRLNATLPVPVLPEWGKKLWEEGKYLGLVDDLKVGGDAGDGIAIRLDTDRWTEIINRLVVEGTLSI
jgi:hypothetical protein